MRLGGPVFGEQKDPQAWAARVRALGYGAAYAPCSPADDDATVASYRAAAKQREIVIAEVGAWSNPISPDESQRKQAQGKCVAALELAERLGASCCVNIAGSRSPERWDGPHPTNFSAATFDLIVESVRRIIDAVKPTRTFYTLETMPWIFPHSARSYLELVQAIDRPAFGVHFDPVNLINCPERLYDTGAVIRDFYSTLAGHIKSIHAKDVIGGAKLTFHVDECLPGRGVLDYPALLRGAHALGHDVPILLEHLASEEEYRLAAEHVRSQARACGLELL
ncbi:MAG TPA: sugar phosphate isomerase/epimerase family protein [Polyangiaceae bacterium]|nr:sugar phosphate isomerase/epimerase family protein [Polyangiaceae bacterium]